MTLPGNGKLRNIIQTIVLALALLYIVVDRVVIPQVGVGKTAESIVIENRFTKLETNYSNIEKLLEKIDKRLENLEKGK